MKKKKIISVLMAAALCLSMAAVPSGKKAVSSDIRAEAVTYESLTAAQYAVKVAELVNQQRKSNIGSGHDLTLSEQLCEAANLRAKEITQKFDHTRPNGQDPSLMMSDYGVYWTAFGENIAMGQRNPEAVMNSWMNSSGHRANILDSSYKYIGVGVAYKNGAYYWVQIFAAGSGMSAADVNPKDTPAAKNISSCTVTLSGSSFQYTGSAITPAVTVKDGSKTLANNTDYTVSYSNNVNAGTASVTITGKGSYTGSVIKNFTITAKPASKSGDLDRNNKVDDNDLSFLQQYVSGWKVNIDIKAADVTGDGKVDDNDVARLQQYLSGWNVTLA